MVTLAEPPGLITRTAPGDIPAEYKAAAAATLPVPHASVSPAPRSHTSSVSSPASGP